MAENKFWERLLRHKAKVVKAVLLAFARQLPVIGNVVEAFREVEKELDLRSIDNKMVLLARGIKLDENTARRIEEADETSLSEALAEGVQAVPHPQRAALEQLAGQLAKTQNHEERRELVARASDSAMTWMAEVVTQTRSSFRRSLHERRSQERLFKPGELIAERFQVLELAGWGGMGTVYKVQDQLLGEWRAIKTIAENLNSEEKFRKRFLGEVKIATRLAHPNIVRVYDVGISNGLLFLSMEWIEGQSLRQMLCEQGVLAWTRVHNILLATGEAVSFAHNQGILHLDIKPENIVIAEDGTVKLVDFGLAQALDRDNFVQLSARAGTYGYMAPEQYEGGGLSTASDIFALGVLAYEMVSGQIPLGVFESPSRMCGDIPPRATQAIMASLQRNPAERPQSVEEWRLGWLESPGKTKSRGFAWSRALFGLVTGGILGLLIGFSERNPGLMLATTAVGAFLGLIVASLWFNKE
jgi:tRNA A-37 threonylcarbamoyl transferase component Bud32